MLTPKLIRWIPAIVLMAIIFAFSSTPSDNLPSYGLWDTLVKKGGHMSGYGLLALAYLYGLGQGSGDFPRRFYVFAWVLTVLYALSDEFHQSFVPGRHASLVDVFVFDAGGAALALVALYVVRRIRNTLS